mmetsp:Transcript_4256/g.8720  ORF Transcript_4256/g.8720 Transcript_4256/m.8720 type:complete len:591 (+) Transcript_4256:151-1923(+)
MVVSSTRGAGAFVVTPITPANEQDQTVVTGFVFCKINWDELLTGLFPQETSGVDVVISTPTDAYTFTIVQGQLVLVGPGDQHDPSFDDSQQSIDLWDADGFLAPDSILYTLTLYENDAFDEPFHDSTPMVVALGAAGLVLLTSCLFYLYDILVRRHADAQATMLDAKRQFVRFISHEVRTPLNSVVMGLTLLQEEMAQALGFRRTTVSMHHHHQNHLHGAGGGNHNLREKNDDDDDDKEHAPARILEKAKDGEEEEEDDDDDDDKQFTTTLTKRPFFNTWNVLRDEYAPDFGFDYKEDEHTRSAVFSNENWDSQPRVFSILGTHVDDTSAQPHVLSPPLMESLLMFVPEALSMENFWLKYSMVRDGASLQTLRHYCRAAPDTILAIETTEGHVLGAFTSHVWKESSTFYGSAPAFLWRMRENRRTPPCHSLFEQAQLESIIDVYNLVLDEDDPNNNGIQLVQLCQPNGFLAIGGGEYQIPHRERIGVKDWVQTGDNYGFGIALLDEDMRRGTTSPCKTFRNKCLVNNMSDGEVFQVANLEVWTFTPCVDVTSAEQMEWRNYYLRQQRQQQKQKQHEGYQDFYRRMGQEED